MGIGLFAGILRLAERRRYRRRLAVLETQHAVERERLRIAQDMHDHIGAILTRISLSTDLGDTDGEGVGRARQRFDRIGKQARTAVQALDEIIWATNPKNDNLPRFAEYVSRYADECFESSNVRCWQEVPTGLPGLSVRAEVRHNVFLAIREGFNNVLKHSGATEVWLRLRHEDLTAVVEIQDNGKGFDAGQVARGNGLENMSSRLAESGGRAEVRSNPGKGTTVRFRFPLGQPESCL
jgi:signal transduction histidine kinase